VRVRGLTHQDRFGRQVLDDEQRMLIRPREEAPHHRLRRHRARQYGELGHGGADETGSSMKQTLPPAVSGQAPHGPGCAGLRGGKQVE
jgi:hypothetical protein